MLLDDIIAHIREAAARSFGVTPRNVPVETPPDLAYGDLAVNAFLMARELRRPPPAIAEALAAGLQDLELFASVEAVKGFVNLRISNRPLFERLLPGILEDPEAFGRGGSLQGQRLMVEFSAPNTNKPQHLGHMRNNFLGDALSRLLANEGAAVLRANLYNDRGIQICKSMLAYSRWGGSGTPEEAGVKGDHYVGRWYVRFETELARERDRFIAEHPEHFEAWSRDHGKDRKGRPLDPGTLRSRYLASFREENFGELPLGRACQRMLQDWESGDPQVMELWRIMNAWAIGGFEETYRRLGISFHRVYRESETWAFGRELVLEGLERGVFERRGDGAVEIDLSNAGLGRKVVLRPDGTAVYITQDIGTTVRKAADENLDGQFWVVAEEQRHHFKVLFEVLGRLGYSWADNLHHLAYGLVHLPEGRMKSREGRVVDADDLVDEVRDLAAAEVRKRYGEEDLRPGEASERGEVIGLAALRFMLLKVSPRNSMTFNPEESVRFEGDTGSRVLYAHARLNTMLQDAGEEARETGADWSLLGHEAERALALLLLHFPRAASRAASDYNPSLVANHLLDIVRQLNRFYEQCDVLREKDPARRRARLLLCRASAEVLRRACGLLGMPLLERM